MSFYDDLADKYARAQRVTRFLKGDRVITEVKTDGEVNGYAVMELNSSTLLQSTNPRVVRLLERKASPRFMAHSEDPRDIWQYVDVLGYENVNGDQATYSDLINEGYEPVEVIFK